MATVTIGRWGLRVPDGAELPNVPLWMNRLATDLTDVAKDNQGTLAARPTSTPVSPGTPGRYYRVIGDPTPANNGRLWRDYGTGWEEIATGAGQARDVGEYKYAVDSASHGARADALAAWVLCDGSELAAGYVRLIAKLTGAPFGTGGAGRPRVPSLTGRVPMGVGTPTGAAGATAHALGQSSGEETHVLSATEMPSHTHTINGAANQILNGSGGTSAQIATTAGGAFAVKSLDAAGGGLAHTNLQPFVAGGSWFLYAGPEG